jgi:hypothetical protein
MLSPEILRQRLAVSALVGKCQALLQSELLNPSQRASLRLLVERTRTAFEEDLPSRIPVGPNADFLPNTQRERKMPNGQADKPSCN